MDFEDENDLNKFKELERRLRNLEKHAYEIKLDLDKNENKDVENLKGNLTKILEIKNFE